MRKRNLLLGVCVILWTSCVYAEGPFQKGATEWEISVGFGDNFHIGRNGNVSEDIQFYFLAPSWGKVIENWGRYGSLEIVTEGFLSYAQQDLKDRSAIGITPLFAYNFESLGKVVPFLELGVGLLYTNLDPEYFGSNFDFTPQMGIGVRYEIARGKFLKFSYRFHHISNAYIDEDNRSIDSHFFLIGISFLSMTRFNTRPR